MAFLFNKLGGKLCGQRTINQIVRQKATYSIAARSFSTDSFKVSF